MAVIWTGPPSFSAPVARSSACSRFTYVVVPPLTSWVAATTYSVLVDGSITGVPVIPISFGMSPVSPVSAGGIGLTPADGLMNESFQSGVLLPPVGVEGVDGVVLRRDVNDVVYALAGDRDVLHVERRGERQPVERIAEQLPEAVVFTFDRRQDRLVAGSAPSRTLSLWNVNVPA